MKLHYAIALTLFASTSATAEEIRFVGPDGKPAGQTVLYQSFIHISPVSQYDEYGATEMMMGEDSGYGGMDGEYSGGEAMDMAGMGDMGYGMGGAMAAMGGGNPQTRDPIISLLNGKPLTKLDGKRGVANSADDDGTLELVRLAGRRNSKSHSFPALAVHESGFSFIPAGTTVSKEVKLRRGGKIKVTLPENRDFSRYIVLTCWQNGFAHPSQPNDFTNQDIEFGKNLNVDDWRFSARYRWFQTNAWNESFTVPPGEVRVTVVPKVFRGTAIEDMNPQQLFEAVLYGGPSTLVTTTGSNETPQLVQFPSLRSLVCQLPKDDAEVLPQWGDLEPRVYRLHRLDWELPEVSAEDVSSTSGFAKFLNRTRDQRAIGTGERLPSFSDPTSVRYEMLTQGSYWIRKSNTPDEGGDDLYQVLEPVDWTHQENVSRCRLLDRGASPKSAAFTMVVSKDGGSTFVSPLRSEGQFQDVASSQPVPLSELDSRSKTQRLQLIRKLRSEVEQTISRLVEHRRRLLAMENGLSGTSARPSPMSDPFGGPDPFAPHPGATDDPFGGPVRSTGPDPFGGPNTPAGPDPFGGPNVPGGPDPFGGPNTPAGPDPFGPAVTPAPQPNQQKEPSSAPSPAAASNSDPFG